MDYSSNTRFHDILQTRYHVTALVPKSRFGPATYRLERKTKVSLSPLNLYFETSVWNHQAFTAMPHRAARTASKILVSRPIPASMLQKYQATAALPRVSTELVPAAVPQRVPDHAEPTACCGVGEASCGAPKYSEGTQPSFSLLHAASIERDMHSVEIDCILADDADDAVTESCDAAEEYAKTVLGPVEVAEMSEPVISVQQSSQLNAMALFNQLHALNLDLMRPGRPQPSEQGVDMPAMIFARTRPKTLDQDLLFARLMRVGSRRERLVKPQSEY